MWKGIRKEWDPFKRLISFDIGNGDFVGSGRINGAAKQKCGEFFQIFTIVRF